jgi:hypothetical protein
MIRRSHIPFALTGLVLVIALGVCWQRSGENTPSTEESQEHSESYSKGLAKKARSSSAIIETEDPAPLPENDAMDPDMACILDPTASLPIRSRKLWQMQENGLTATQQKMLVFAYENPRTDKEWAWKNDLIQVLASQAPDLALSASSFTAVLKDRSRDPVVREYTLQYVYQLIARHSGSATHGEMALISTLRDLLHEDTPTISGGALIALARMPQDFPIGVDLQQEAVRILREGSIPDQTAAAQTLGFIGTGASALRQSILESSDAMVRAAALNSLAQIQNSGAAKLASEILKEDATKGLLANTAKAVVDGRISSSALSRASSQSHLLTQPVK